MAKFERYLGDGAYARLDDDGTVVLYTSDGIEESNHIYFEHREQISLRQFLDDVEKEKNHAN